MGGRIAEELINGKSKVTTGAQNDLQVCTETAKQMVNDLGMSEAVGLRTVTVEMGDLLRKKADDEVDRILEEQYRRGFKILSNNKDALEAVADLLIEKEKITGQELHDRIREINPSLVK